MANLDRIWSDDTLVRGDTITGDEMKTLDDNITVGVNGDDGGEWNPTAILEVGGEGVEVASFWQLEGAGNKLQSTVDSPILFGSGDAEDYFGLATGHVDSTRVLVTPIIEAQAVNPKLLGIASPGQFYGTKTYYPGSQFCAALRVYNGAKLSKVDFHWSVTQTRSTLPENFPRARVIAVRYDGTIIPLRTPDGQTDLNGFIPLSQASIAASYYLSGNEQMMSYQCTVEHTVDLEQYSYFVEILDEVGANVFSSAAWYSFSPNGTGNLFIAARATFTNISLFNGRN